MVAKVGRIHIISSEINYYYDYYIAVLQTFNLTFNIFINNPIHSNVLFCDAYMWYTRFYL